MIHLPRFFHRFRLSCALPIALWLALCGTTGAHADIRAAATQPCEGPPSSAPSRPLELLPDGPTLHVIEARESGRCSRGSVQLPSPALQILPVQTVAYVVLQSGALAVIDLAAPQGPRITGTSQEFCYLHDLHLDPTQQQLEGKTGGNQFVRWTLANPLRPKLTTRDVDPHCPATLAQNVPPAMLGIDGRVHAQVVCSQPDRLSHLESPDDSIPLQPVSPQAVTLRMNQAYSVGGQFPSGQIPRIRTPTAEIRILPGSRRKSELGRGMMIVGIAMDVSALLLLIYPAIVLTNNFFDAAYRSEHQIPYTAVPELAIASGLIGSAGLALTGGGLGVLLTARTRVQVITPVYIR